MMRADAARAACVAFLVTAALLLLSLSGCEGCAIAQCGMSCHAGMAAYSRDRGCVCIMPDGGAR